MQAGWEIPEERLALIVLLAAPTRTPEEWVPSFVHSRFQRQLVVTSSPLTMRLAVADEVFRLPSFVSGASSSNACSSSNPGIHGEGVLKYWRASVLARRF